MTKMDTRSKHHHLGLADLASSFPQRTSTGNVACRQLPRLLKQNFNIFYCLALILWPTAPVILSGFTREWHWPPLIEMMNPVSLQFDSSSSVWCVGPRRTARRILKRLPRGLPPTRQLGTRLASVTCRAPPAVHSMGRRRGISNPAPHLPWKSTRTEPS